MDRYSIFPMNIDFFSPKTSLSVTIPFIANAILDRILHHAKIISISGKSYRLKDHLIKKRLLEQFYLVKKHLFIIIYSISIWKTKSVL